MWAFVKPHDLEKRCKNLAKRRKEFLLITRANDILILQKQGGKYEKEIALDSNFICYLF